MSFATRKALSVSSWEHVNNFSHSKTRCMYDITFQNGYMQICHWPSLTSLCLWLTYTNLFYCRMYARRFSIFHILLKWCTFIVHPQWLTSVCACKVMTQFTAHMCIVVHENQHMYIIFLIIRNIQKMREFNNKI